MVVVGVDCCRGALPRVLVSFHSAILNRQTVRLTMELVRAGI